MPRFQSANLRRNLELIDKLKGLAAAENCTPAQLALAWVLSRARHIVPIPGHQPSPSARGKCRGRDYRDLGRYRTRAPQGICARGGERAALPGEPSCPPGDPIRTVLDVSDALPAYRAGDGGANVNRHRRGRRASAGPASIQLSSTVGAANPPIPPQEPESPGVHPSAP